MNSKRFVSRYLNSRKPFFIVQEGICIANKYVLFHRSVARQLYFVTEQFYVRELQMLLTTWNCVSFYYSEGLFLSCLYMVWKLQRFYKKSCTTIWQMGFKFSLFQVFVKLQLKVISTNVSSQLIFTYSKLTTETLERGLKYV